MTTTPKPRQAQSFRASILVKCLLILSVAILTVAGVLTYRADRNTTAIARDGMQVLARDITEQSADKLQGAVRLGKADIVSENIQNLLAKHPDKITAIVVLDAESKVIARVGAMIGTDLITLAATSKLSASLETTRSSLWVAYPIGATDNGTASGALAIGWTDAAAVAALRKSQMQNLAVAAAVFVAAMIAAGLLFRLLLAAPLNRLAKHISDMTNGDLVSEITGQDRHDEIGLLSRELDNLRAQLLAAEKVTKDAQFKSAGFLGSSTALAMTDADLVLTHYNDAFASFLASLKTTFLKETGHSQAPDILGLSLSDTINDSGTIQNMIAKGAFPVLRDLRIGDLIIALKMNRVKNDNDETVGYILEWEDTTISGTNNAIIDALEADQLRADFDSNGCLKSTNSAMNAAFPTLEATVGSTMLDKLIATKSDTLSLDQATSGKSVFDKFDVAHAGVAAIVSGSITPILDRDDNTTGYVFLGKDITAVEFEKREALAGATAMEEAQKRVVESLSGALTALSQGDLSTRLSTPFDDDYETLRNHFNESVLALDNTVSLVMDNSGAILGEAGNISAAADDLSRRTEQQAATLEQFAAALTQITASVASAADGASKASEVVTDARKNAEASGSVVREAVDAMGEIANSSEQISRIISVIDDIAFQTNLLALNAGVEAARAGDAGRGFAVVASEVRALAQRSSEAAREINTLISTSGDQVKRGVSLVDKAGAALNEIVTSVGDIEDHVTGIAASAREQSTGLEEINTAISQLDQVTQQNVAMFEETTAATHTLTAEASALVATTSRFRISGATNALSERPPQDMPKSATPATTPTQAASPNRAHEKRAARPTSMKSGGVTDGALAIADDDDWEDF